ncbi:MAG: hypothetical protein ACF8MF_03640 [Phycisphaerales bacterium JB052]
MNNTTHKPICPKCGYDQSGEIATWQSQCPLEGTCPECGLAFDWADVFDPSRVHLSWYVEHAAKKRGAIRRIPATLWYLAMPNYFWKRLSVQSPVYPKRLWAWVGIGVVMLYCFAAMLSIGLSAYRTHRWNQLANDAVTQGLIPPSAAAQYQTDMSQRSYWSDLVLEQMVMPWKEFMSGDDSASQVALVLAGMILLWAVILVVIPITRRRAKLRMAHVHRATTLSLLVVIIVFMLIIFTGAMTDILRLAGLAVSGSVGGSFGLARPRFVNAEMYARWIVTVLFIATLVWIQWFWIAAVVRGWRIRSFMLPMMGLVASLLAGFTVFMYLSEY